MTNSGAAKADAVALARDPLLLEDLLENGQGVGRIGGLVTFVTGGLPGERVRIAVDEVKRNYASAHSIGIDLASPDRVDPGCVVFPKCGGCQTLHLRYDAERAWKRRLVAGALSRIGGFPDVDVDEVAAANGGRLSGYRNKVSLVCRWQGGRARLGFYAARSHTLVPIERCPVLIPRLASAVEQLIGFAADAPQAMRGVDHVVARASATGPELAVSFNGPKPNRILAGMTGELRQRIPELSGIISNWEFSSENAVFGKRFAVHWGSPIVREQVCGAAFGFGIASFFQVNTAVLEMLAAQVLSTLAGATRVVDLYCGVGTFGVLLGKRGTASAGVESFNRAVSDAGANASENGVTSASFECSTVGVAVSGERGRTLLDCADAVIVDPPRRGCESGVLESIAARAVPRILYVSCNPATLARDAKILAATGYRIKCVSPFDMFPHTGHVEVFVEFNRAR